MGVAAPFLVSSALELGVWVQDPDNEPGIFGDPLGLNPYDVGMRLKEINNGHVAMFVAVGTISANLYAELNAIKQCGLAATGTMKSSSPRGLSFAGRSFCARAQSSAVSRRAFDVSNALGAIGAAGILRPVRLQQGR